MGSSAGRVLFVVESGYRLAELEQGVNSTFAGGCEIGSLFDRGPCMATE